MRVEKERDGYLLSPETEDESKRLAEFVNEVSTRSVVSEASQLPLSSVGPSTVTIA
jgi:hypothetical protein